VSGLEVLLDGRAFLEGPRWRDGALWVSDMHAHEVLRVTPDGAVKVVLSHTGPVSGLGFLPNGSLLVVAMEERTILRVELDGPPALHADLSGLAAHEINDMVVDKVSGRAYVSQFGYDFHGGGTYEDSDLLRADADGTVSVAAPGMRFANGSALTPDGRTLIVGESMGRAFVAFTVGDDGTLHDRRVWAEVEDAPDGMCLDADGAVWFAGVSGRHFVRVEEGGRVTHQIPTDEGHLPIAVALGDHTLYGITATVIGPDASREARGGRIVTTSVDTPGCECP
jgi:sugar lactone lactonase YvrE